MSQSAHALATLLPVLYLVVALIYGMELGGPRAPRPGWLRHAVALLLLACHLLFEGLLWRELGHFQVADPWSAVSLMALALLLTYLPIDWLTRTPTTGVFVIGAAFFMQLFASAYLPRELVAQELAESPFFPVHAATALLAIAALLLSGLYGALYLLLLRQMRRHRFGVLFRRLPDLERLSRLNRGAATLGFVFLTLGVNAGLWWAHSGAVDEVSYLDPKILPMLVLWILFGVIAASRWLAFLSGRRAAVVAVAGASLLLLAVVVTFLPLGRIHHF